MSLAFSPSELYSIAIAVERRGAAFYDTLARSCQTNEVQKAFLTLAANEHQHIQTFQKLLAAAPKTPSEGFDTDEYAGYFKALVDSSVFNDDLATSELVAQVDSDVQALEVGIGAEKDSILFYEQLNEITAGDAGDDISRIISEEKAHLRTLVGIKNCIQQREA